jgi:hypothetical protein
MEGAMRIASIMVCAALAGCSAAPGEDGEATTTRTIVYLDGDREPVVKTEVISVAEQQREAAARIARLEGISSAEGIGEAQQSLALYQDPACGSTSIAMWDQPNFVGHELCLAGSGWGILSDYQRTCTPPPFVVCATWSSAVRSWYAPWKTGFWQDYHGNQSGWGYVPWFQQTADATVAAATSLYLYN